MVKPIDALLASDRAYDAADKALRQWRRSVYEALSAYRADGPDKHAALITSLEADYEAAIAARDALERVGPH